MGDNRGAAHALNGLGMAAFLGGDPTAARTALEEAAELFRTTDDAWGLHNALNGLGEVARFYGDFRRAETFYEESLALARQDGDEHGVGLLLYNLALIALHNSDGQRATELISQVVRVWSSLGYRSGLVTCVGLLGAVASIRQRPVLAARLFGAAQVLFERVGRRDVEGDRAEYGQYLAPARAALDPIVFEAAWNAGTMMSLDQAITEGLAAEETEPVVATSSVSSSKSAHEPLTIREWEVAQLVARGLTNRQVASELVVTEATAAKHVENIRAKLELTSRTQVAAWVFARS